jgi:hypothetical protein
VQTDNQDAPPPPAPRDAYGQAQPQQPMAPPPPAQPMHPVYGLPSMITIKPATFVTVRINQELASNHNGVGDTFSGTLAQPIVVNGIVVAQRGQMVYGRVAVAEKVKGLSRLGVELTSLTLVDGTQVQLRTQLISRQGGTTPAGEQAGVITSTTAAGAVIGAIADGGAGAAAGAGIGAAAGIIGVLATRNRPSVIYPETMLTFQTEHAIPIDTTASAGAFRYVGPDDYPTQVVQQAPRLRRTVVVGPAYYPYYDPFYYPYGGWGRSSIFIGGGIHFGGRRWR